MMDGVGNSVCIVSFLLCSLCSLDLTQHALVADYFSSMEKGIVWDFSF